jgi:hypothetical protein
LKPKFTTTEQTEPIHRLKPNAHPNLFSWMPHPTTTELWCVYGSASCGADFVRPTFGEKLQQNKQNKEAAFCGTPELRQQPNGG